MSARNISGLIQVPRLRAQVIALRHHLHIWLHVLQEEVPQRDVGLGDLVEDGVGHVAVPVEVHAELLVAAHEAGTLEGAQAHDVGHDRVVGLLEQADVPPPARPATRPGS